MYYKPLHYKVYPIKGHSLKFIICQQYQIIEELTIKSCGTSDAKCCTQSCLLIYGLGQYDAEYDKT